jgi:hypothetical protein
MDKTTSSVPRPRGLDLAWRVPEFIASAVIAGAVYVVWTASVLFLGVEHRTFPDFLTTLALALFFSITSGFALAMLLMIVPWAIAVWGQLKTGWNGRIYFPVVGAALVFLLGCIATSISPVLLFVPDQTFLEGALLTAQRQGLCLVVSGIAFGACHWRLERNALSRRVE